MSRRGPEVVVKRRGAGAFSGLVSSGDVGMVTRKMGDIVKGSYLEDARRAGKQPVVTDSETKRRFDILASWFQVMRGDMKWSTQRTLDELKCALRDELDGVVYTPSQRSSWAPGGTL